MLTRLYVDNFKCLVDFDFRPPDPLTLVVGRNGAGKTSVFEVLLSLANFVRGRTGVSLSFPPYHRTAWMEKELQHFEIDVGEGKDGWRYSLILQQNEDPDRARVAEERLTTGTGSPLVEVKGGEVQFWWDDGKRGPKFPADPTRSGLTVVADRPKLRKAARFRSWFSSVQIVAPYPSLVELTSLRADAELSPTLKNFPSWYRSLVMSSPEVVTPLFQELRKVVDGFDAMTLDGEGDPRVLRVQHKLGKKSYPLNFTDLSDGQRVMIALYTLVHAPWKAGGLLCLDEPDNFVTLAEIQPLLFRLQDLAVERGTQVLLVSHNSEVIDYLGPDRARLFRRDEGGPVQAVPFEAPAKLGMNPSQVLARGWEE